MANPELLSQSSPAELANSPFDVSIDDWISNIFDKSTVGILRVDLNLLITYANDSFLRISGLTEWRGRTVKDLLSPESFQVVTNQFQQRREGLSSEYDAELVRADDKHRVPIRIAGMPLISSNGSVTGAVSIIRDISVERAIQTIDAHFKQDSNPGDLIFSIAKETEKIFSFDTCTASAFSRDMERAKIIFSYSPGAAFTSSVRWYPLGPEMKNYLSNREIQIIDDYKQFVDEQAWDLKVHRGVKLFLDQGFRSLLRCPVFREGRLVASLSFSSKNRAAFNERHKRFLEALPIDAVLLIAIHFDQIAQEGFRFSLLRRLLECTSNKWVTGLLVKEIAKHFEWSNVSIFDVDDFSDLLKLNNQCALSKSYLMPENHTQQKNRGILGRTLAANTDVNVGNVWEETNQEYNFVPAIEGTISELCMPIRSKQAVGQRNAGGKKKIIALLNIEDTRENAFSEEEVTELRVLLDETGDILDRILRDNLNSAAIDAAPSALFVVNRDGTIRSANPAANSLLGCHDSSLKGRKLISVFDDEAVGNTLVAAGESRTKEVVLRRLDGEKVPALVAAKRLDQGFNGESIVTAKDLQAYKRSDMTKILEKMYYEVAVQYKTPLSLAFTWLAHLKDKLRNDTAQEILQKTLQQLAKVELTFDRLALFDRSQLAPPFEPRLLDIVQVMHSIIEELPTSDAALIQFNEQDCDLYVYGDLFQLSFVFRTILSYLLRSSPPKATKHPISVAFVASRKSLNITFRGPSVSLDPRRRNHLDADPNITRALWEMTLGRDSIILFMQNHRGALDEKSIGGGRRIFRLRIPLAKAAKVHG